LPWLVVFFQRPAFSNTPKLARRLFRRNLLTPSGAGSVALAVRLQIRRNTVLDARTCRRLFLTTDA
jgi:hypothetical protein